jgi:hypothetical protein
VCSNVKIKATNSTAGETKVTKFEYYDYADKTWRTEVMLGLDGHQKLERGKTWSTTQDAARCRVRCTQARAIFNGSAEPLS